jgi:hypothetical protein
MTGLLPLVRSVVGLLVAMDSRVERLPGFAYGVKPL